MIPPPQERRPPITPQLAVRVAILGGIAFALFAIVFFRLWFLQVLTGNQYLAQAQVNRVRNVPVQAPRGKILDRNGKVLVDSTPAVAIAVSPRKLPQRPAARHDLFVRLSKVLGMSTKPSSCKLGKQVERLLDAECIVAQQQAVVPYADATIKNDVPRAAYVYLAERQQQFPGISIQQSWVRAFPLQGVGAQVFGTTGAINANNLHDKQFRGVKSGRVGQSGLEYQYDPYLRGRNGAVRISVDALGRASGEPTQRKAIPGANLRTSLDRGLEKAGQQALQTGMGLARGNGNVGNAGAFVALDPRNGEVLAMGSAPTFDPSIFNRPIKDSVYESLLGKAAGNPPMNRAVASAYPVGSTFKVVTAAAALATGIITAGTIYDDTGTYAEGTLVHHNAGNASYGPVDLREAIKVSVDTFFFKLGHDLNADPVSHPNGGALQQWARRFGLGQPTGIDLGSETAGNVPSANWRKAMWKYELACRKRKHVANCHIADSRPWSAGDNTNLAVGQGDFVGSPLQMAVLYAAIENGGTIVRPHVGLRLQDGAGRVVQSIDPGATRHVNIPDLAAIQDGLRAAAGEQGGTSADVMSTFPKTVYGKTGTAERYGQNDQAWYVCYVPDPVKPIVVAVTIEQGGFGDQSAAPAARLILSQWFGVAKQVVRGTSTSR